MKSYSAIYYSWYKHFGLRDLTSLTLLSSLYNDVLFFSFYYCYFLFLLFFFPYSELEMCICLHFFSALSNIEIASFLRWYVLVELHDPVYAKRFYCTYEMLEDSMIKVLKIFILFLIGVCFIFFNVELSCNSPCTPNCFQLNRNKILRFKLNKFAPSLSHPTVTFYAGTLLGLKNFCCYLQEVTDLTSFHYLLSEEISLIILTLKEVS